MARECDHIVPKAKADADGLVVTADGETVHFNDLRNLQPLCIDCHDAKSAREAAEARGYRPRRQIGPDGWPVE